MSMRNVGPGGTKETNGAGKHTIGYEETVLNEGEGMDAASGKFTVPLAGVYRYSFQPEKSSILSMPTCYKLANLQKC